MRWVVSALLVLGAVVAAAAFAWAGFHRASPPADRSQPIAPIAPAAASANDHPPLKAHADGVVDYVLHARLDPSAHTVQGAGTILWRNRSAVAVTELWFHLYLNAFKNEDSLFLRTPTGSGRGRSAVTDWGYIDVRSLKARELDGVDLWATADRFTPGERDDQTDIRVPLPTPVEPGATLTLDVEWDDKLPNVVERTGCASSFCMVAQWFPKIARLEPNGTWAHFPFYHLSEFYSDFGTYDVTIDVPEGHLVGATGVRVSETHDHGRQVLRYVQSDVHDFAWTSWDGFRETAVDSDGVRLRCLYPQGAEALAERELRAAQFAIAFFGERFGRYPYEVLTIVHPPEGADEAGGMEYPTLITTGGDPRTPSGIHDTEIVTVHEFGHQYFYGLVATNESLFPVLDEGLTTYAEAEALDAMFGSGSAIDGLGLKVSMPALYRATSMRAGQNEPIASPAASFPSGADYGAIVYARTGLLLLSMAGAYGREPMLRAMGAYARRYRFAHPRVDDFVSVVREYLGADAAANLEKALWERGWVDYELAEVTSSRKTSPGGLFEREGKRETMARQTQSPTTWEGSVLVRRRGTLMLPVDVELVSEDGSRQTQRWDGRGDVVRLPYAAPTRLVRATVDPASKILLDEDLYNNGRTVARGEAPWRTLERAVYGAELLLQQFAMP